MKKQLLVTGAAVPDASTLDHREIDEAGVGIYSMAVLIIGSLS